jgi:hypothetical protein
VIDIKLTSNEMDQKTGEYQKEVIGDKDTTWG